MSLGTAGTDRAGGLNPNTLSFEMEEGFSRADRTRELLRSSSFKDNLVLNFHCSAAQAILSSERDHLGTWEESLKGLSSVISCYEPIKPLSSLAKYRAVLNCVVLNGDYNGAEDLKCCYICLMLFRYRVESDE